MTAITKLKEELTKQYEETLQQVYKLQGAIATCDKLLNKEEPTPTDTES